MSDKEMYVPKEGDVVKSLRALAIDNDIIEEILGHETVRPTLSMLTRQEGMEAVQKLGDSLQNRLPELKPIEDHAGYFLKILSHYTHGEGEVVASLRKLRIPNIEKLLKDEDVRAKLSSLSRSEAMEAVQKLRNSLNNRAKNNLDPIGDIAGYFMKILQRYDGGGGQQSGGGSYNKKRQRENDNGNYSDGEDSDMSVESKLRLAHRRVGRYKTNYYKSERMVNKLEAKVAELTSELDRTKRELEASKMHT